mmetsp:Transcript_3518/g.5894  ORF Transcript_3518/g.5894 Transcript_3518/m.5894 type:complete len:113 (-) Transcript_3518:817-1155(-)
MRELTREWTAARYGTHAERLQASLQLAETLRRSSLPRLILTSTVTLRQWALIALAVQGVAELHWQHLGSTSVGGELMGLYPAQLVVPHKVSRHSEHPLRHSISVPLLTLGDV